MTDRTMKDGIIEDGDSRNPVFRMEIEGLNYSFSLAYVEKDKREWLRDVVARQLKTAFKQGVRSGKRSAKVAFDKFMLAIDADHE